MSRHTNTMFVRAGMLTADGRCKTLDASADGYTRQEACGAIAVSARHLVDHGGAAATTGAGAAACCLLMPASAVNQVRRLNT